MEDRANIAVQDNGKRVYLYTHWLGHEAPEILRRALARRQRWDDPADLARIIFCKLVNGYEGTSTGFGISAVEQDNDWPVLVVNCTTQTVSIEKSQKEWIRLPVNPVSFTFSEYVELGAVNWELFGKVEEDM